MKAATLHDSPPVTNATPPLPRETTAPRDAAPPRDANPHLDDAEETLHEVADEAIDVAIWATEAKSQLDNVVRENPYASVAVAAGVGYVLGGGLPAWAVRMAVQAGTRLAVSAAVAALVTDPNASST